MNRFRFGVLAAVSSDPQAEEDKFSLEDQIEFARAAGRAQGGMETTEPFILDGYTRTGYVNLSDALEDIPPLAKAVESIQANQFDVLIVDNIERLGDLAPMLFTLFGKHRKQIHSARQSGRIHDPKDYDPYADEAAAIMMHVEGILQKYRINKIRRGWKIGVPRRIEKGLHPLSLTYGYRLTGKDQPAAQVPEICHLLVQLKDMMLSGVTYTDIARQADASGVRAPRGERWSRQTVKRILLNPYYAGIVRFGKSHKRVNVPRSEWKLGQGKHAPLWNEDTYRALVAEDKRRMQGKRNYYAKYPFTGLTVCGICGSKISKHGKDFEYLACNRTHSHWAMRYEKAIPFLTAEVIEQFKEYKSAPHVPPDIAPLEKQLEEIKTLRARIQAGYEVGLYNDQEALTKLNALQEQAEEISVEIADAEQEELEWEEWQGQREELDIEELREQIKSGDGAAVNHLLFKLIEKIILKKGEETVVAWR